MINSNDNYISLRYIKLQHQTKQTFKIDIFGRTMTATYKRSSNTRALSDRRHRLLQPMSHVLSVTLRYVFNSLAMSIYSYGVCTSHSYGIGYIWNRTNKSCGRLASIVRQTVLSICNHHWLPL